MPGDRSVRPAECSGRLVSSGNCRVYVRTKSGWLPAGVIAWTWGVDDQQGVHLVLDHDGRRAGVVLLSVQGWQAKDIVLRTPLLVPDALAQGPIAAWQVTGRQVTRIPELACGWQLPGCTGRVQVEVASLVISQFGPEPLGGYLLDIEVLGGQRLAGRLSTIAGPLTIDGQIEKSPLGGVHIIGRATLAAGVPDNVRRLLASVARLEGPDTFAFSYSQ